MDVCISLMTVFSAMLPVLCMHGWLSVVTAEAPDALPRWTGLDWHGIQLQGAGCALRGLDLQAIEGPSGRVLL